MIDVASIQLMGGEKDGHTQPLVGKKAPDMFYAVPNCDDAEIRLLSGKQRMERTKQLAVLAYKLRSPEPVAVSDTEVQWLYDRFPEADIVRKT